jgi:tetratricopeptide (TPR) repeat protein
MLQSQNNDQKENLPSVFLSHSSEDNVFAKKLADRLERSGVKVWLDEYELNIGDSLTRNIGSAIDDYDFFAIVLSERSTASEWVQRELENALNKEIAEKKVVVLPILLEKVSLPSFLKGKVYGDFTSDEIFEESFKKLLRVFFKDKNDSGNRSDKFYPDNFIPDLKFFVGREKLLENLKTKLDEKHRASIHDISGLGKTFTTYKFADQFQDRYERIFFVRVSKEEMLKNLAEIGVLLNPYLKDEPDQSKQAKGFKDWLEKNDGWLVIYDNVDIPDDLFPFVPLNKKGDCLFTSNFPSITYLGVEVTITKLDKYDAEQLLFSRSHNLPRQEIGIPDKQERKAFEKIIEEIDGHPLSLNTTGAFISKKIISFEEFYRKLNRTPNTLLENEDGFDKYQNKSALKAFTIALDDIAEKKADDEFENSANLAQKLLFVVSLIAPDNIPEILLQKTLQNITEIDFEAEENEDLWQEIRRKLLAYDLLKYDRSSKLFNTHRLIQKVIQTRQSDNEQKETALNTIIALDRLFPRAEFETRENCELYAPHAIEIVQKAEKVDFLSKEIAYIYYKIGTYLLEMVKYQEALRYFEVAINLMETLFGIESSVVGDCKDHLALVYKLQGNYKQAEKFYLEAIEIGEKAIGKEHSDHAIRLNNLALVYKSQDRYDEAIVLLEQAIAIGEKTIGDEHPDHAARLSNLAGVYKLQGRYDEAIKLYKQAIVIGEKTIGREHPNYASRLNNLAGVYDLQDRYDEAIELYKQAIVIGEKTIGREHPNYAACLNNLGGVYEIQGRYNEALGLFKEALKITEKSLPINHPYNLSLRESVRRCLGKI